ncbi:MAG: hypothetical protein KJ871_00665, partial [Alphaproteobacteria bacterium]|nr:hypothetical protein [Alphaproteobacteria bacterium]
IVGLSQQVPFIPRLLHGSRAKRLLDSLARIEVSAPGRDPAIVPPDPASAFEVRIVFDALHDVGHWSTKWSQFGPQFPAISDKEKQPDLLNPFAFNVL